MVSRTLRIENRGGQMVLRGGPVVGMRPVAELAVECRFRVDLMCGELGVSERHLHRVFSDSVGLAPKDWLRRERMVSARYRLREGGSIKEVALDLGFAHPKDFTREFRVCYGLPPSAYLEQETERSF